MVTLINYKCSFFEVKYLKIIALLHISPKVRKSGSPEVRKSGSPEEAATDVSAKLT